MVDDIGFIRRKNPDSTTDLICLCCFVTVGSGKDETDFAVLELSHRCDPLHVRFPLNFEDRMSLKENVERFLNHQADRQRKHL